MIGVHDNRLEFASAPHRHREGVSHKYDQLSRGWRQLILKKKSLGPGIGNPSKRSLQLFFTVCYNIDSFRDFVFSDGFQSGYVMESDELETFKQNDVDLMLFGFRLLKQVLFGEQTIGTR